jgi:uncharacterized protein
MRVSVTPSDIRDSDAEMLRTYLQENFSEPKLRNLLKKFTEGAERGDPRYQYALGEWLVGGVEPVLSANPKKGFRLFKQAAKAGVVEAAYAVGLCLRNGIGCEPDGQAAVEWYHRAALLGSRNAMGELAKILYRGELVEKNVKLAKIWVDAANQETKPIFYYREGEYSELLKKAARRLGRQSQ